MAFPVYLDGQPGDSYPWRPNGGEIGPFSRLGLSSMLYVRRLIVVLLPLLVLAGCTPLPSGMGKSPLMPTQMSPDSVVLDMFFVRFPFGDAAVNEKLWQQIDEQQFAPDLRERLAKNGFRVGVVGGQLPVQRQHLVGFELLFEALNQLGDFARRRHTRRY